MTIAIMGLIGVGKSTLIKSLQNERMTVFLEPTKESEGAINNPFLELYYDDPCRWSYAMQTFMLFERHKMVVEASYRSLRGETCILDGCCESDMAFALVQQRDHYFTPEEFFAYENMYNTLRAERSNPDTYVWLDISPEDVMDRIKKRSRNCESNIPLDYLRHLDDAYQEVLHDLSKTSTVISIDARNSAAEVFSEVHDLILHDTKNFSSISNKM